MKKVLVHWVEMRTLEVPDECPTDKVDEFEKWIYERDQNDPYAVKSGDSFCVNSSIRDFEIVDVEAIEDVKVGVGEDATER